MVAEYCFILHIHSLVTFFNPRVHDYLIDTLILQGLVCGIHLCVIQIPYGGCFVARGGLLTLQLFGGLLLLGHCFIL